MDQNASIVRDSVQSIEVFPGYVDTQIRLGAECVATDGTNRLAAVPDHMFTPPGPVGQELSAPGHRAECAPTWRNRTSTVSVRPGACVYLHLSASRTSIAVLTLVMGEQLCGKEVLLGIPSNTSEYRRSLSGDRRLWIENDYPS